MVTLDDLAHESCFPDLAGTCHYLDEPPGFAEAASERSGLWTCEGQSTIYSVH